MSPMSVLTSKGNTTSVIVGIFIRDFGPRGHSIAWPGPTAQEQPGKGLKGRLFDLNSNGRPFGPSNTLGTRTRADGPGQVNCWAFGPESHQNTSSENFLALPPHPSPLRHRGEGTRQADFLFHTTFLTSSTFQIFRRQLTSVRPKKPPTVPMQWRDR